VTLNFVAVDQHRNDNENCSNTRHNDNDGDLDYIAWDTNNDNTGDEPRAT